MQTERPVTEKLKDGAVAEARITHPAFGLIHANRVTASPGVGLNGTDFLHSSFIRITVHEADIYRSLSSDRPYDTKLLLDLNLSEAQWASFVSSLNYGVGTSCTLRKVPEARPGAEPGDPPRLGLRVLPGLPPRDGPSVSHQEALESLEATRDLLRETLAVVDENVVGLSRKKQDAVRHGVKQALRKIEDQLPFIFTELGRHYEKTRDQAKTEVGAYILQAVQRAGLSRLREEDALPAGQGHDEILQLGPAPEEEG